MIKTLISAVLTVAILIGIIFSSYKYGEMKAEIKYNTLNAKLQDRALKDQESLQQKMDELSYVFFKTSNNEQKRISALQRQLRNTPNSIKCTKDTRGNTIALIPSSSIRMLTESVNFKALSKTTDKSCSFNSTKAITATDLSEYTICIIGKYNTTGEQLKRLIQSVKVFQRTAQ